MARNLIRMDIERRQPFAGGAAFGGPRVNLFLGTGSMVAWVFLVLLLVGGGGKAAMSPYSWRSASWNPSPSK